MRELADLESDLDQPLRFSWASLPREEHSPGGYSALFDLARFSVALSQGREAWLSSLHQYLTYGGVLAGLPLDDESRGRPVYRAVERAADLFGVSPMQVAILPPTMLSSKVRRRGEDRELTEMVVDFLPPVCSIGRFQSNTPVHDEDALGSTAIVVWFQKAFGCPEDGWVTDRLRDIDWSSVAADWNP